MKENKNNTKNLIIYLIIFAFVVAVSINAIINQESKKQEIKMQISQYEDELKKLKSEKDELIEQKEKINTDKYIENVARNKLDMFLPNEKVYVHSRW
ncbi:MAG: cell division protein FtsL [Clostridiales bacterium]|jgi:cell division protein ftsL|nr:cell division protein FtsL [Clostridiales bacterium]